MGWQIGFDPSWNRDIGYGVPATCDYPGCGERIDRGLSYVCGGAPYGGEHGCGLFFCTEHLRNAGLRREYAMLCSRCYRGKDYFTPTADVPEWNNWKLTDASWQQWRDNNSSEVAKLKAALSGERGEG